MSRLLFIAGILEGLNVSIEGDKNLLIAPGVAIDDQGRQILLIDQAIFDYQEGKFTIDLSKQKDKFTIDLSKLKLDKSKSYNLLLNFKEEQSDPQDGGQKTRFQDIPKLELTTSQPISSVLLATLEWNGNNFIIHLDDRQYSGLKLPGNSVMLKSQSGDIDRIILSGSLSITGNVGIGITSPSEKLEVNGNLKVTGAIIPSIGIGNTERNGIIFSQTKGGGKHDQGKAWIKYYKENEETDKHTLEIGIGNNFDDHFDDHIVLMPSGNIGIGERNPTKGKLQIEGNMTTEKQSNYHGLKWRGTDLRRIYNVNYSLYAKERIACSELNTFSDLRIKEIKGSSDNQADLKTLLQIEITDYYYKDKIANDNRPKKKVIGQQVACVYPQAVSTHIDTVPDILEFAVIEENWVTLTSHTLKIGDKVKILWNDHNSQLFTVEAIAEDKFKISLNYTGDVFVYGREVDDFHVVDYDALSMLHISATQELYKMIQNLERKIDEKMKVETLVSDIC